jgi:hypothetical protein
MTIEASTEGALLISRGLRIGESECDYVELGQRSKEI